MLFDKVMVPVDLSDVSAEQVQLAARLQAYGMKEMVLFFAVTVGDEPSDADRQRLNELASLVQDPKVKVHVIAEQGGAANAILKIAKQEKVSMLVMASTGKTKAKELVIGSTSLEVVRRSKVPVLVNRFMGEKTEPRELLDEILVALDLGPCTEGLMSVFKELDANGCKKAVLFHTVISSKYSMEDDIKFQAVKTDLAQYRENHKGSCTVDTHIHYGTPAYNVIEAAREFDVSLIVMGNQGKGLLHSLTLGSVSDEVLRKSSLPVLIVPCR